MKRVFFFLLGALLLRAPASAKDSKLDAPPAGLSPANTTIAAIFKAYDAATGALSPGTADTREERWDFTKAGFAGTEVLSRSGHDYVSRIVRGPLTEEYGQLLGHRWHLDENGVVSAVQSDDWTSFDMLLVMRNVDDAEDPKSDVKLLGETADPKPAYVVQVNTTGARHPEWFYYDKQTGLVDRITRIVDGERATLTFDDYRTTKGLTEPWHVHAGNGDASLDDDFVRRSLSIGLKVNPNQLATPHSSFAFAKYSGALWLPARVINSLSVVRIGNTYRVAAAPNVVVRLTIAGRGYDFALSAAQSETLVDYDVAQSLGLPTYGQTTRDSHGAPVPYDTTLPHAEAGALTLDNLAVRAMPFHYHLGSDTKIVGLLGFDVLSTGVFKIDFLNGSVLLSSPQYYDTHLPDANADVVPLNFDDGLPFFSGDIAGHETSDILIDNDFDRSLVFGSFTQRYPDAVKDANSGKPHMSATIPFADAKEYGRDVDLWYSSVPDLQFGPAHFMNLPMLATDAPMDLGGHEVDAVMGGDILKYYDMYLDYPHSRILLKPNKNFFKVFKVEVDK